MCTEIILAHQDNYCFVYYYSLFNYCLHVLSTQPNLYSYRNYQSIIKYFITQTLKLFLDKKIIIDNGKI